MVTSAQEDLTKDKIGAKVGEMTSFARQDCLFCTRGCDNHGWGWGWWWWWCGGGNLDHKIDIKRMKKRVSVWWRQPFLPPSAPPLMTHPWTTWSNTFYLLGVFWHFWSLWYYYTSLLDDVIKLHVHISRRIPLLIMSRRRRRSMMMLPYHIFQIFRCASIF